VLLHLESKFYFTLNPTAAVVWKALGRGETDVSAIAEQVVAAYRVEMAEARRDVEALLDELVAEGLLA
jgi:hypothetical protein